jgi:hypothetical protein
MINSITEKEGAAGLIKIIQEMAEVISFFEAFSSGC